MNIHQPKPSIYTALPLLSLSCLLLQNCSQPAQAMVSKVHPLPAKTHHYFRGRHILSKANHHLIRTPYNLGSIALYPALSQLPQRHFSKVHEDNYSNTSEETHRGGRWSDPNSNIYLVGGICATLGMGYIAYRKLHTDTVTLVPIHAQEWQAWQARCEEQMQAAQAKLAEVLAVKGKRTLANTLKPSNEMSMHVGNVIDMSELFTYVHTEKEGRAWADETYVKANDLKKRLLLNKELYQAIKAVPSNSLDPLARRWQAKMLKLFQRAGVDKDDATRRRIATLNEEILTLEQAFGRNLGDDTRSITLKSVAELEGLPEDYIKNHPADEKGKIEITTRYPDYLPIMSYAKNREVRKRLYQTSSSRGYPKNQPVLINMLRKRYELAQLLGYPSYAAYDIEKNMIGSSQKAKTFVLKTNQMAEKRAKKEYDQLLAYRRQHEPNATKLESYDYGFWLKKYRTAHFDADPKKVRPYLAFDQVKQGLLDLTGQLFGLHYKAVKDTPVWHADVETYDVYTRKGNQYIGRIHLDMHPREGKFQHACHQSIVRGLNGKQKPESALICNFPKPTADDPAWMEPGQVVTFFHEFGHLMHALISGQQDWFLFSGTYSFQLDIRESPSKMLEEWVLEPEVLQQFAKHPTTKEPLSIDIIKQLKRARDFGIGIRSRTQSCYAMVSFVYHDQDPNKNFDLDKVEKELWKKYHIFDHVPGIHFHTRFGHLTSYGAAYYTYLWSEAIAQDLFGEFKKHGVLEPKVCERYREAILATGGRKDGGDLLEDFLGRPLSLDAYQNKIEGTSAWTETTPQVSASNDGRSTLYQVSN